MSNGILEIRENEINEIHSAINKSVSNMETFTNKISPSFKNATDAGLLNKTTDKIKNQMNIIHSQTDRMNKTLSNAYENMSLLENELTNKAEEIIAPKDFDTNDSSHSISYNIGKLNKDDGQAIKKDSDTNTENLKFNNVLEYNNKLKNIVKEYESINGEIEIQGNITDLVNIKKQEVKIDGKIDENSFEKAMLTNISKEINDKHPEINDSFEIKSMNLKALKNTNINQTNYDDLYINCKKEFLKNINNGNYVLKNYKE